MKIQSLPNKSKSAEKLTKKNKITIQKQQPLPAYLCDSAPVFYQDNKSISQQYFNEFKFLDEDIGKCKQLLTGYIEGEKQTERKIQQLTQFTCNDEINFKSGFPFYSCKNIIFNEYLICLKMYELFRLNSADFTTGPGLRLYQRLVYLKTLILKLGPVQKKLQYQKNKLLKKGQKIRMKQYNQRAGNQKGEQQDKVQQDLFSQDQESREQNEQDNQDNQNEEDNLAYKPMVKNLISNNNKSSQKQGKYIAPKISAVLPTQQKTKRRQQRQNQRRKAHLLMKFRGDIESGDEAEQKDMLEGINPRFKKRYEQKLRFQQENFTRLNETKKQKYWKKQMMKNRFKNTINDEINEIQMIRELLDDDQVKGTKRTTPIGVKPKHEKTQTKKKRKID